MWGGLRFLLRSEGSSGALKIIVVRWNCLWWVVAGWGGWRPAGYRYWPWVGEKLEIILPLFDAVAWWVGADGVATKRQTQIDHLPRRDAAGRGAQVGGFYQLGVAHHTTTTTVRSILLLLFTVGPDFCDDFYSSCFYFSKGHEYDGAAATTVILVILMLIKTVDTLLPGFAISVPPSFLLQLLLLLYSL